MIESRNLKFSTVNTGLLRTVSGGKVGGVFSQVHYHLHSLERVELQVDLTVPDHQLIHFLLICRLVTILDETNNCGVVCKLQELHREVRRGHLCIGKREVEKGHIPGEY